VADAVGGTPGFDAWAATDIGRVRSVNQDQALVGHVSLGSGRYVVGLVADGMGGGSKGEDASRIAAETLMLSLAGSDPVDPREALVRGIGAAHVAVVGAAAGFGFTGGTFGTTLVCALVEEATSRATIANVGDSRAYVISAGGVRRVTRDHSIVAERLAARRISEQEAREAADRSVLTRAVGAPGTFRVDVFGPRDLLAGDRLVLCSDGLHGMLDEDQIGSIAAASPRSELASALVQAANQHGGEDNISVVVLVAAAPGDRVRLGVVDRILVRWSHRRKDAPWPMETCTPALQADGGR
jgi:protein phosphatase